MDDYMHLEGKTLGHYQLQDAIDTGGLAEVYTGFQPSLKRQVAVKVLKAAHLGDPELERAFVREAEILAQVEHARIVPIYDFGEADGLPYLVMRLITGGSLKRRLRESGVMSPTEVSSLLKQLADALEYVYSCGYVHGNLRTSNVLFDQWGSPFLTDFSFAELFPKPDTITGTPAYLAPEKWRSEPATPATDQYALGAMVYKMLTDHLPFEEDRVIELMQRHLNDAPPPLSRWRDDLPLALEQVVLRALAKTPEARYPSVSSFATAFDDMVRGGSRQVFISYSHSDTPYAQRLREHLQANGFDVWIDETIGSGEHWFSKIQDAIRQCAALIVVMSPDAEQSEWVEREILLAQRFKKPIFPLLLSGEGMGLLINIQHTDVRGDQLPGAAFFRRLQRTVFGDL